MTLAVTQEFTVIIENWHVGRSWPGMFPHFELTCPCPKAPCGLVAPVAEIPCDQHMGNHTLRQAHLASDCASRKRWPWHRTTSR